ncbi:MAG: nitroreductase family protein [Myxococcota bacterium]
MSDFIPYQPTRLPLDTSRQKLTDFYERMDQRRSVRFFSPDPVPRDLIETAIRAASTAPSGAHRQPWRFVAVSDPTIKRQIRIAAEAEEKRNYDSRFPQEWLDALAPIGTDWQKPFLEIAPWLVIVFAENHGQNDDGSRRKNYYVKESVGLACGLFIAALHQAGLSTLTHTPSPMRFLTEILQRPSNEQPFILFPVGYPTQDATVPNLERKPLEDVSVWFTPDGGSDG